jgi:putative ABC transport system permease protein
LTAQLRLSLARYKTPERQRQFVDELLDRTRALPGVEWVGVTTGLPTGGYGEGAAVSFEGQPEPPENLRPGVPVMAVTPDYFHAMGITLLRGRGFSRGDDATGAKAAVVTQAFARRFYPSGDALGQRIRFGGFGNPQWIEIAGVTDDIHHQGREVQADPQVFLPYSQHTSPVLVLALRARSVPEVLARAVREAANSIDSNQPIYGIKTMEERVSETGARRRVETLLLAAFALLALTLAAVGIYGVVSEAVGQRTREIGVRMALGARSTDVVRMILRRSLAMALAGVAAGVAASFFFTKFLATMLFEVKPTDAASFAAAAGALLLVALAAAYLPARRAAHIDPAVVLRGE